MKLSEAMMLGSVTCEMKPADFDTCALGAAGNAVGIPRKDKCHGFRLTAISNYWPWIAVSSKGCDGHSKDFVSMFSNGESTWAEQIFYRFDRSVVREKTMTLEQLVDYVRSIEPACGDCNRFDCTCEKAANTAEVYEAV